MVALPVATFSFQHAKSLEADSSGSTAAPVSSAPPGESAPAGITSNDPTHSPTQGPVDRALPWIVALWMGGVFVLSVRLAGGFVFTKQLLLRGVSPAPETWRRRLEALAHRAGIPRPVWILVSTRISAPRLIGWLRPVILMPASATTGLPPAQLEAILLHELAHVRRHDYVVNLAQAFVETAFFFHPAVWWVSGRVRLEREHCCDDIAVRGCGDARLYTRALLALEGVRGAIRTPVLAADGGGPLLSRARRLLTPSPDPPKPALAAVLFAALVASLVPVMMDARAACEGREMDGVAVDGELLRIGDPDRLPIPGEFFRRLVEPVTIRSESMTIPDILRAIERQTSVAFELPSSAERLWARVDVRSLEARRVVETLLSRHELSYEYDDDRRLVAIDWWAAPGPENRGRRIDNASIAAAEDLRRRKEKLISFEADGLDLGEALDELGRRTGIRFAGTDALRTYGAHGRFDETRVFDVYESLLNAQFLTADYDDDGVVHAIALHP